MAILMHRRGALLALGGLLVFSASCQKSRSPEAPLSADSARIVCVSKQLTEMIFALGMGSKVVGTDLTSNYPPETAKLPKVGYHRLLSVEGIISLHPTALVHDGNMAPPSVLEQAKQAGIPVLEFKEAHTIAETKEVLRDLGAAFHVEQRADSICHFLDSSMAVDTAFQTPVHPKVALIHFGMVANNYLVIGQKNLASKLIEWAGGVNPIQSERGMAPLSAELIADAQPDVIFATDYGFDHSGGLEAFKKLPGVALTPAALHNRIYRVEEHDLVYLGPRTGQTVVNFRKLIFSGEPTLAAAKDSTR